MGITFGIGLENLVFKMVFFAYCITKIERREVAFRTISRRFIKRDITLKSVFRGWGDD